MSELRTVNPMDTVPLYALREKTRNLLSQLLNCKKIIPAPDGMPRDYRGLAHLAGIANSFNSALNPTGSLLHHWEKIRPFPAISQLKTYLEQIDRWDVLDDCAQLIEDDINEYIRRKEAGSTDPQLLSLDADKTILTLDDVLRIEQGLDPQIYDAFLLFAPEDEEDAKRIVDKLENDYGHKLCLRDRDLVGGVCFEHEAIMRLISERCNRLIIIISPYFLESRINKFFVDYAQALGINQRHRKIIPCKFRDFQLPPQLSHYFILDHNRAAFWDFWDKLSQSLSAPSVPQIESPPDVGAITIKELQTEPDEMETRKLSELTLYDPVVNNAIQDKPNKAMKSKRNTQGRILTLLRKLPSLGGKSPGGSKELRPKKKAVIAAS